jgi:hypothetical protein
LELRADEVRSRASTSECTDRIDERNLSRLHAVDFFADPLGVSLVSESGPEDSANSRPFSPAVVYPRRSIPAWVQR